MVTPYIRSILYPGLVRLRVTPDEPAEGPPAITEVPPRGYGRPHADRTVAKVRHLIESTDLTYRQIAKKCGVSYGIISRWVLEGAWQRPPHAPRASDMVPSHRAGRRLRLRKLAGRLETLAERCVRELEQSPSVEVETLMQALQVLKMARLEAQGGHRRRSLFGPVTGAWQAEREQAIYTALKEMRRRGVDIDRAPKEALDMVVEANTPVEDHPALHPRGWRRPRARRVG
jgi:transposase